MGQAAGSIYHESPGIQAFYQDQFKMHFVDKDFDSYLKDIHRMCKERNLLRTAEENYKPLHDQVMEHIKNDDIEEAIDLLTQCYEQKDTEKLGQILAISGRFNYTRKRLQAGILGREDANLEVNEIRHSLLELLKATV